jgi:hypothetical protein
MRLEARAAVSRPMQIAAPFVAVAFTLVVCSLLVAGPAFPSAARTSSCSKAPPDRASPFRRR